MASPKESLKKLLEAQRKELESYVAKYVDAENCHMEHIAGVEVEELNGEDKEKCEEKKKKIEEGRKASMLLSALNPDAEDERKNKDAKSSPSSPPFRGKDPKAMQDPHELLNKCESKLKAGRFSEDRWIDAMLQSSPAEGRKWAQKEFAGMKWEDMQQPFMEHFDAPALRSKLRAELSNIKKRGSESAQECSDRFTSLMERTRMKDDNLALVDAYINGLSKSLQAEMRRSKAAESRMLKAAGAEPSISMHAEAQSAIALDAADNDAGADAKTGKKSSDAEEGCRAAQHIDNHQSKNARKRKTDADHDHGPGDKKSRARSKHCWHCGEPNWKPGHKRDKTKNPESSSLEVKEQAYEAATDELPSKSFGDKLIDALMDHGKELGAMEMSKQPRALIYAPVIINGINGIALVGSGAAHALISEDFAIKHDFKLEKATGIMQGGAGDGIADREGASALTIQNGMKTAECVLEWLKLPLDRDMVIGLDAFGKFGYRIEGAPVKTPHQHDTEPNPSEPIDPQDDEELNELNAALDLNPLAREALAKNQKITVTSRRTRPLAALRINPDPDAPIWMRRNYAQQKGYPKARQTVKILLTGNAIELAPNAVVNCFPLLLERRSTTFNDLW